MARRIPPIVSTSSDDATPGDVSPGDGLEPIPGDTFSVRAELKALGAVWDPSRRQWCIAAERLALARAIVDNQTLAPPPVPVTTDLETMADPFEEMGDGPRQVALEDHGGDTYAARDALRAVGARWDKESRAWVIREERAAYARAIVEMVRTGVAPDPLPDRPLAARETRASAVPPPDEPRTSRQEGGHSPANVTPATDRAATGAAEDPPTRPAPARRTPPTSAAQAANPMAERIKLGGLWLHRTRDGREYLSGRLSPTVKILIFQNDFKSNDNQPSHVMYLAPVETEEAQQRQAAPDSFFGSGAARPSPAAPPVGEDFGDAGGDSGDFDEDYLSEIEAPSAPPAPSASRPAPTGRPAAAPPGRVPPDSAPSRPANGPRPAPPNAAAPPRRGSTPAPAGRRPEPAGGEDADDPFGE